MGIKPTSRPKMSADDLAKIIPEDAKKEKLILVGIRGYYKDSMGKPGVNDRGLYDDAIFIVSDTVYRSFNANTDPSSYRKGRGTSESTKGMASLKPGFYHSHKVGLHKGVYTALIQTADQVTVVRDGNPPYDHKGWFGINIHRGGYNGTSSLGCQTIHPDQWREFIDMVQDEMDHHKIDVMPYLLLEA